MPITNRQFGYSLFEITIVIAIVVILASIAIPSYENYVEQKNITVARKDILALQGAIDGFYVNNNRFPDNLGELGEEDRLDPWGSAYYYTNVSTLKTKSGVRKDKNLTPVNSDYDLYSAGKDGETKLPFTAAVSRDDIVRCNNGQFIGMAIDY